MNKIDYFKCAMCLHSEKDSSESPCINCCVIRKDMWEGKDRRNHLDILRGIICKERPLDNEFDTTELPDHK